MMRYITPIMVLLALLATSCNTTPSRQEESAVLPNESMELKNIQHQAFFNNLKALCGQSFQGKEVYTAADRNSWQGLTLSMELSECEDGHIYIPLKVGDDASRTWMLLIEEGELRFRHDHRLKDGSPDPVTLYGGYASSKGNAFAQFFPADAYTCELIAYACQNEWNLEIAEDFSVFTYRLYRDGELRLQADFNLREPLNQQ